MWEGRKAGGERKGLEVWWMMERMSRNWAEDVSVSVLTAAVLVLKTPHATATKTKQCDKAICYILFVM